MKKIFVLSVIMLMGVFQSMNSQTLKRSQIIPLEYNNIDIFSNADNTYFCVTKYYGNSNTTDYVTKNGILDKDGKTIIPLQYNQILRRNEGLFIVGNERNNQPTMYGVINIYGRTIVPVKHNNIEITDKGEIIMRYETYNNQMNGMYDKNGKTIIPFNKYTIVSLGNFIYLIDNGKCCLLSENYRIAVPYGKYNFNNSCAGTNLISVNSDNNSLFGVIDKKGQLVVPQQYDRIWIDRNDYIIVKKNEKYGLLNSNGQEILPLIYDKIESGNNNLFIVEKENLYGVFNAKGEQVLALEYLHAKLSGNYIVLNKNKKKGVCDSNGTVILPIEYNWASVYTYSNGLTMIEVDGKACVIKDSSTIVPLDKYDKIEFDENKIIYVKNRIVNICEENGTVSKSFSLNDEIKVIREGLILTKNNKTLSAYDYNGTFLGVVDYDNIKILSNRFALVGRNEKCGIIKY